MLLSWRIARLERKVAVAQEKVKVLVAADEQCDTFRFTQRLLEARLDYVNLDAKLRQLKGKR
jgi:hypothetical protein